MKPDERDKAILQLREALIIALQWLPHDPITPTGREDLDCVMAALGDTRELALKAQERASE